MRSILLLSIASVGIAFMPFRANAWERMVEVPSSSLPFPLNEFGSVGLGVATLSDDVVVAGVWEFIVARLASADGTEVWRYVIGPGSVARVATDAADDVIAAGDLLPANVVTVSETEFRLTVAKLDGATGVELWRKEITGTGSDAGRADDLAVDVAGDVFVAGRVVGNTTVDAIIAKLSGATGAELWRHVVDGGAASDEATTVRVDPPGNAIAVGHLVGTNTSTSVSTISKMDGATGAEIWRDEFPDTTVAGGSTGEGVATIVVNDTGDVAAMAFVPQGESTPAQNSVYLLAALDGSQLWRTDLPKADSVSPAAALALLPSGVLLASDLQFGVTALAHADGHALWRRVLGCGPHDLLETLAVDPAGDVVVLGTSAACPPNLSGFTIGKLSGADGSNVWQRTYGAEEQRSFTAHGLAVTPAGDIAAVGSVTVGSTPFRTPETAFTVLRFSGTTGALGVCRDGFVDAGEACDDGNASDADCCLSTCQLVPDGTRCSDSDLCTTDDACQQGVCKGGPPLPCEPCGTCVPSQGCLGNLPFACLTPTAPRRAVIRLVKGGPRGNALTWEWGSGAETSKSDFGDPRKTDGYALCVYNGGSSSPLVRATAPPGRACSRHTGCWRRTSKGFAYQSPSAQPAGLSKITLRAGGPGKAKIVVQGKGRTLDVPGLPLDPPVVVQLRKVDGSPPCWSAEHSSVIRSEVHRFSARGN